MRQVSKNKNRIAWEDGSNYLTAEVARADDERSLQVVFDTDGYPGLTAAQARTLAAWLLKAAERMEDNT